MNYKSFNTIILIFVAAICFAQSRSNPFDIESRIQKSGSDTIKSGIQIISDSTVIDSENPFDVDHVPLRRQKNNIITNTTKEIKGVKPQVSNSFIFWIMVFSWALLAIVITNKTNLIGTMLRSVFNINMLKLSKREEGGATSFHYVLLYMVFMINISIFIYQFQIGFSHSEGLKIWLLCFGAIIAIYVIRHLFLMFLGQIFPIEKETSMFNYIIVVFNILLGICIIPINLILTYGPEYLQSSLFYIGLGICGILLIIRYLRGLSIGAYAISLGFIPFLIYLCAAEIAPVLFIISAVSNLTRI